MEPEFILDLDKEEELEQLATISKIVSEKPKKHNPEAIFLKKFTLSLFRVGEDIAKKRVKKIVEKLKPKVTEEMKFSVIIKKEVPKVEPIKLEIPKPNVLPEPKFPEYTLITTLDGKPIVTVKIKDSTYYLDEPLLSNEEKAILKDIKNDIANKLLKKPELGNDKKFLLEKITKYCKKYNVNADNKYEKLRYYLLRDVTGFGIIDPLLKDGKIKEIVCDGIGKSIIILYEDKNLNTTLSYNEPDDIDAFINKFAESAKQKLVKNQAHFTGNYNNISIDAILGLGIVSSKFIIKK